MARVGLNDIEKRTATHAAFANMFKPSTEVAEEDETEKIMPVASDKKRKAVNVKAGFGKTEIRGGRVVKRQTYYISPLVIEALRAMDYDTREGISSAVDRILAENIPEQYMEEARERLRIKNDEE